MPRSTLQRSDGSIRRDGRRWGWRRHRHNRNPFSEEKQAKGSASSASFWKRLQRQALRGFIKIRTTCRGGAHLAARDVEPVPIEPGRVQPIGLAWHRGRANDIQMKQRVPSQHPHRSDAERTGLGGGALSLLAQRAGARRQGENGPFGNRSLDGEPLRPPDITHAIALEQMVCPFTRDVCFVSSSCSQKF